MNRKQRKRNPRRTQQQMERSTTVVKHAGMIKAGGTGVSLQTILWVLTGVAAVSAVAGFVYHETKTGATQKNSEESAFTSYVWGKGNGSGGVNYPQLKNPSITGVTWNTGTFSPSLTINGANFGSSGTGDDVTVTDETTGWEASSSNTVQPQVDSWSGTSVDINQLSNYGYGDNSNYYDGEGTLSFAPGDDVVVTVTNPTTGQTTSFNTQYPTNAPLPRVTITQAGTVIAGQSTLLTGTVTFNGQPLANQAVNLSVDQGSFSGGYNVGNSDYMVYTDSNGNWSVDYNAPNVDGLTTTITAMADHATATTQAQITNGIPEIDNIAFSGPLTNPTITVTGKKFGTFGQSLPYTGDSNLLALSDLNGSPSPWNGGASGDTITTKVLSWSDTKIVFQLSGGYANAAVDSNDYYLTNGDTYNLSITNPQSNQTTSQEGNVAGITLPTVTVNNPGEASDQTFITETGTTINGGITVTGRVTDAGGAAANQNVVVTGTDPNGNSYKFPTVITDANGNFTATYNQSVTGDAGAWTFSASVDGVHQSQGDGSLTIDNDAPPYSTFYGEYGVTGTGGNTASSGAISNASGSVGSYYSAQSRTIDLGSVLTANSVTANIEGWYETTGFPVQISTDGTNWTTIGSMASNNRESAAPSRGTGTATFNNVTFRYIRYLVNGTWNGQYTVPDDSFNVTINSTATLVKSPGVKAEVSLNTPYSANMPVGGNPANYPAVIGQPVVISGHVDNSNNKQALANQTVLLTITSSSGQQAPTNYAVSTDSSGNFTYNFTPTVGGQFTVTATSDYVSAPSTTFNVENPKIVNMQVNDPIPTVSLPQQPNGTAVQYFPLFTFQQLPKGMTFGQSVQTSPYYPNMIWSGGAQNGTEFAQASFNEANSGTGQLSIPDANSAGWVDDIEIIYVNGKPVARSSGSLGVNDSIFNSLPEFASNTQTISVPLVAGKNTITIEGINNNGYGASNSNPGAMDAKLVDASGTTVAWTGNSSTWGDTGLIYGTPSWLQDGATAMNDGIYVMQEKPSAPEYSQTSTGVVSGRSYTVTGTLTANGVPVSGQTINLSTNGGTVTAKVTTNANGDFSATYTPPSTAGTYTITATGDGATQQVQVNVQIPHITSVDYNANGFPPTITVNGIGFGTNVGSIGFGDQTASFSLGSVAPQILSWSDTQIVFTYPYEQNPRQYGGGDSTNFNDGHGNFAFRPNDSVYFNVTTQGGFTTSNYGTTYPASATMPVTTLNSISDLNVGTSETISGTVKFNGSPLTDQAVFLTSNGGTFSGGGSAVKGAPNNGYMVWTDGNGNYSVTYNAPASGGTYKVTAQADGGTPVSQSVTVNKPSIYTFTTAGATGRYGPSQTQLNNAYAGTDLSGQVTSSSGIQLWTVPATGTYTITTYGAQGGNNYNGYSGGLGAIMSGQFQLTAGEQLKILVGQQGSFDGSSAGGGGGSFVSTFGNTPLIVAGGGGGSTSGNQWGYNNGVNATTGTNATDGDQLEYSTSPGTNGYGGTGWTPGGGGGFYGNSISYWGGSNTPYGGYGFEQGGVGGIGSGAQGGFGGGGGGWDQYNEAGGGGGWSGGNSGDYQDTNGGGGGSYNSGSNPSNSVGNYGNGEVVIAMSGAPVQATSYTFTNAGATGQYGPTQAQLNSAYVGTSLASGVKSNSGVQDWTVPATGTYEIDAYGAQGGNSGGDGAVMKGDFNLTAGTQLEILVGQMGTSGSGTYNGGGGGGGTFVAKGTSPLIVAGGGGGYTNYGSTAYMNATTATNGQSTLNSGGGTNGGGGSSGYQNGPASGGGGFTGNGQNGGYANDTGGLSFTNGGTGGTGSNEWGYLGGNGGFGGGGGAANNSYDRSGGGGGYSGGQGGTWNGQQSGGGGGSYNSGSNQSNTVANTGQGKVVINYLG